MTLLIEELYPICRSIMGPGTRATLDRIGEILPLERNGVASGTNVLDWVVPDEWEISDAFVSRAGDDERIIDFREHNLHVVSHSVPVDAVMPLDDLQAHLHSLPDRPHSIPYRTSYYARTWGFCLADEQRRQLEPGDYRVVIESRLRPGRLEWGELVIPGDSEREVLLTTHICHPALVNDNLTGIAALVELGRHLADRAARRYTYRLLFLPGTIGSIAWLANSTTIERIAHGLVITGLGDSSAFTYKQSRRGVAEIDRIAVHRADVTARAPRWCRSRRTATTSGSSAHPGSIFPSVASPGASTASTPSITRRPTISDSSRATGSRSRSSS